MDSGDKCFDGKCPVGYSTYELDFMKWRELKTLPLTGKQTITLEPVSKGGVGYKLVNPDNENEYYILENRQCDGYDQYLGWARDSLRTKYGANTGLLITHVDYDKTAWESNTVDTEIKHQGSPSYLPTRICLLFLIMVSQINIAHQCVAICILA